ncbi:hypothetical protein RP20_CCG009844 [Aedes albopictus]|nr:hypothetical protein RP20_CCG009844 [Aedes albopictus]
MSQIWFLALLVVIGKTSSHAETNVGDYSCDVPHELEKGVCVSEQECPAFTNITNGDTLGSASRLSFVKALQCALDDEEPGICCPSSGAYRNPELTANTKRERVPKGPSLLRFGAHDNCGSQTPYVPKVYGRIAEIDDFPWAALLIYRGGLQGCGGALISRNFVITAAHCLTGTSYDRHGPLEKVRLAEYNTLADPDCVFSDNFKDCNNDTIDVPPKSIKIHPDYNQRDSQQYHDIGLIELEREVNYSDFLLPICLPYLASSTNFNDGKRRTFDVCGWGRTDFFDNLPEIKSPVKLKAKLPFVKPSICNTAYKDQNLQLGPGQLCAGGRRREDSCAGDSGSPLMFYQKEFGDWVLIGIVSQGAKACGQKDKPGIYTNVEYYLDWILENADL